MKIEIEDKQIFDMLLNKFVNSNAFKYRFEELINKRIKEMSNDFFMIGYQKGLKERISDNKIEKWVSGKSNDKQLKKWLKGK